MDEYGKRRLAVGGLILVIVVMMVQNYFLVRKNEGLVHKLENANASLSERQMLVEGDSVHSFKALTLSGNETTINPGQDTEKTMFFVFTTTCPVCAKNIDQWNWIARESAESHVNVVGICPDSLYKIRDFVSHFGVAFPAYSIANDSATMRFLRLNVFPQTILIASDGRVVKTWGGLLSNRRSESIESLL